jgi:hypothetical protein
MKKWFNAFLIDTNISYKIKNNERIVSDFHGLKDLRSNKENILTITSQSVYPYIASYDNQFLPPVFNIPFSIYGTSYCLAYSKNIVYTKKANIYLNSKCSLL